MWDLGHFSEIKTESATWHAALETRSGNYVKRPIESYPHRPRFELYDIQDDPTELNNLADDPEYSGVREELKTKLKNFQQRTMNPWIVKWEHE